MWESKHIPTASDYINKGLLPVFVSASVLSLDKEFSPIYGRFITKLNLLYTSNWMVYYFDSLGIVK